MLTPVLEMLQQKKELALQHTMQALVFHKWKNNKVGYLISHVLEPASSLSKSPSPCISTAFSICPKSKSS